MKLSEAMRLGAMLRPRQAFHVLYDRKADATCALGAIADAVGLLDTRHFNRYLADAATRRAQFGAWAWIQLAGPFSCPVCGTERWDGQHMITHLNNEHRWTREQIADWLEALEALVGPAAEVSVR